MSTHTIGADLLPDYFLDEAEDFQDQWLKAKSEIPAESETMSGASHDTPEGVFNLTRTLLTEEVVKQINATFLFVVDGKYPGEFNRQLNMLQYTCNYLLMSLFAYISLPVFFLLILL